MGDKDIISKRLLKRLAADMARILLKLEVDEVDVVETQSQRVEERRADLVVKARSGNNHYLLHIEIQNHNEPAMPWRMLRYRTDIRLTQPLLPIHQHLLYIGKQPLTMATGIDEAELNYRYRVVDMHNVDCETLLRQDTPEALVIAILADFNGQPERDMVRRILRRLAELTADNQSAFRDYLLMLEILSSNRDLKELIQQEETMLSQVKYSDLPSYGLGMQQGMQQGEALSLIKLLELKFGAVSGAVREHVHTSDADTLLVYLERILTAETLADVLPPANNPN